MCYCLRGQYHSLQRLSCAECVCLHLISTMFLIAFSAAAADHHSPIPKGLHHRPPREYRHPLRGEGKASPHVRMCEVWCLHSCCCFNHHLSGFRQKFQLTASLQDARVYSVSPKIVLLLHMLESETSALFPLFQSNNLFIWWHWLCMR